MDFNVVLRGTIMGVIGSPRSILLYPRLPGQTALTWASPARPSRLSNITALGCRSGELPLFKTYPVKKLTIYVEGDYVIPKSMPIASLFIFTETRSQIITVDDMPILNILGIADERNGGTRSEVRRITTYNITRLAMEDCLVSSGVIDSLPLFTNLVSLTIRRCDVGKIIYTKLLSNLRLRELQINRSLCSDLRHLPVSLEFLAVSNLKDFSEISHLRLVALELMNIPAYVIDGFSKLDTSRLRKVSVINGDIAVLRLLYRNIEFSHRNMEDVLYINMSDIKFVTY